MTNPPSYAIPSLISASRKESGTRSIYENETAFETVRSAFAFAIVIVLRLVSPRTGGAPLHRAGHSLRRAIRKGSCAICPWDLFFYEDKLYIGAGDYDKNAGPIHVWAYDTETSAFVDTGTVPDEEVSKFLSLGDTVVIPGTDPQSDWSHGNYYVLENGAWSVCSQVEGGIHMFDMVEHEGYLFAGLGVLPGASPIVRSKDEGESFEPITMKKNGSAIDTSAYEAVRVYDFFVCGRELYALFVYGTDTILFDLFRYESGCFSYVGDWTSSISMLKISRKLVNSKATLGDKLYFATGCLYTTDDMNTFTVLQPPHATAVYDLLTDRRRLYVLSAEKTEEGYRISVSSTKTGEADDFREEFYFYYSAPPISFEKKGDTFYFGMGSISEGNEKNGMILEVKAK